jgi:hypothetical protein
MDPLPAAAGLPPAAAAAATAAAAAASIAPPPMDLLARVVHPHTRGDEWVWSGAHSRSFAVRAISGKGLGAVATRFIALGECVLLEQPLLQWAQDESVPLHAHLANLHALVAGLDTASYKSYFALSQAPSHGAEKSALGVFLSNAYPCDGPPPPPPQEAAARSATAQRTADQQLVKAPPPSDAPQSDASAVFTLFSRWNHACRPNTDHAWLPGSSRRIVRALRPIAPGEELTCSYIHVPAPPCPPGTAHGAESAHAPAAAGAAEVLPRTLRRAYLRKHFGFDCDCAACGCSGSLSPTECT